MFYSVQNINNSILIARKAMPQKDSTTTNESSFALARNTYTETYKPPGDIAQSIHKKWFGNRDASQVTANRKNTEIGVGTLNAYSRPTSFTTNNDINATQRALMRVRSGGAVSPAKKNANLNNAPTPTFAPAGPKKSIYGLKTPVLFH